MLGSLADLATSATCPDNQDLYRELVDIEIISSFSFQSSHWLGDLASWLLTEAQQRGLIEAKQRAAIRERAEARIPRHLLYVKGWPTVMPTHEEARLLGEVRRIVADTLELTISYRDSEAILVRYAELMQARQEKAVRSDVLLPQVIADGVLQPLLMVEEKRA